MGVSGILDAAGKNGLTPAGSQDYLRQRATMLSYAASGGNRSDETVEKVSAQLRAIAISCGFPDNSSQVARSKFDIEAAMFLGTLPDLSSGEALRDDVWSYMATVAVPDIVSWRFPDRHVDRFEGGVRNALQRLWNRAIVLDRGAGHAERWALLRGLSEDAAVQIFERPSIAGNQTLAISLAEAWIRTAAQVGRSAMEPIMRRASKLVRLRNEIFDIAGMSEKQRDALVLGCFEQVGVQGRAG